MIDLRKQKDNDSPNFNWKFDMKSAQRELKIRIGILEQTGNVECAMRTKRCLKRLDNKLKEWTVA